MTEFDEIASLKSSALAAVQPAPPSLSPEDARRLLVILESVDSLAVLDHRIDSPSQPTLREALSASATPLPALRSLLAHVTASLLRPASPAPPPTTADRCRINEVDSLLSSLLDELEQKYAPDSRRDDEPSPAKKTMLHRSIPGFDFFTAPGELTPDQLRKLSQVADTDVISLVPPPKSHKAIPPAAPKLSEINSTPLPTLKHPLPLDAPQKAPISVPAKTLSYGAYQSFGPKYDSTNATMGYTSSVSHYRSERRIKQWETTALSVEHNIPLRIGSKTVLLTAEESALLTALDLSPDLLVNQGIKGDANNLFVVEEELRRNEERLSVLMRGQWERLRTGKDVSLGAGVVENTTAQQLIKSLSRLLASCPPSTDADRETKRLPRMSTLATMASLAKEESFTGGMDGVNLRAVKESAMMVAPLHIKGEEFEM